MGASSASTAETTINTSTESASTLATNVTGTDTSETCDSLDLGNYIFFCSTVATEIPYNDDYGRMDMKNLN